MSRSARLHGAAEQALTVLGETIEPLESGLRDRDCGRLRSAIGAEAFEAEYAAGRALTFEQVLALALGNQTLCPCFCPADRRLDACIALLAWQRMRATTNGGHHGGTRGEGTVWRGVKFARRHRETDPCRVRKTRRSRRGLVSLRTADQGNHQASWATQR
jgi:hypothetical protein